MNLIQGIYRNGCITLDTSPVWPEGMRVFIEPEPPGLAHLKAGEDWPEDRPLPSWHWTATMGTYRNGRVCPDERVDWPEGTRVDLEAKPGQEKGGLSEDDGPATPEKIAALLARMDEGEPLEMTPEEEAELAAWRQKIKEYTLAHKDKRIEGLFE